MRKYLLAVTYITAVGNRRGHGNTILTLEKGEIWDAATLKTTNALLRKTWSASNVVIQSIFLLEETPVVAQVVTHTLPSEGMADALDTLIDIVDGLPPTTVPNVFFVKDAIRTARHVLSSYREAQQPCAHCSGTGYTEALSMNWTEDQFDEYSCPVCNIGDM